MKNHISIETPLSSSLPQSTRTISLGLIWSPQNWHTTGTKLCEFYKIYAQSIIKHECKYKSFNKCRMLELSLFKHSGGSMAGDFC